MSLRLITIALSATLLCACATHDGIYSPGCIAYEGSKIRLSEGRFSWERFTDAIVVDADGNAVNQFPGYPMQGSYRLEGQTVQWQADSGESLAEMYLQRHKDRYYLLTAGQLAAWQQVGEFADCALVLGGYRDN